jgi:hypothetical protein
MLGEVDSLTHFQIPQPIETAGRLRAGQSRDDLCAGGLRKGAFFLVATFTGIALERFDALTRDNEGIRNNDRGIRCSDL